MDGGFKSNPLYESDDEGDPRIDALYDLMDADGDGEVTKTEFVEFLRVNKPDRGPFRSLAALQEAFGLTKKTFISRGDFHSVFTSNEANGLTIELFSTQLTPPSLSSSQPTVWRKVDATDTTAAYYWNVETNVTSWTLPVEAKAPSVLDGNEVAAVNKLYDAMDADGDGKVTQIEFVEFLRINKPTAGSFSSLAKLQSIFDLLKYQAISRDDFLTVFAREKETGLASGLAANLFQARPSTEHHTALSNIYGPGVDEALATIASHHPTIAAQFAQCSTGGKTIPPEVLAVYKNQIPDSVGVLFGMRREAEGQLADLHANPIRALGDAGKKAKALQKERIATLKKEIAGYTAKLEHCFKLYSSVLQIPLDMDEASLPTLTASMPVAATATETSMQRGLGMLWLVDKAAAASGNKKLQQLVKKKLNTALGKYDAARNELTGVVVPLVVGDVTLYQAALDEILASGGFGGGAVSEDVLNALEKLKASIVPVSEAEAVKMTADPRAPDPFSPAYLVYSRLLAAETSPVLYRRICKIIADTGCNAIAVPGGVKGEERMVFKTLTNYGGNFSKCRDISRITIVVATMRDLWLVARALQSDEVIRTIRGKFRFSPGYDPVPTGGYRDTQYQVLIEIDGIWRYAEVQLNLHPFMMLKNKKDAGHGAFIKARAIAAYSAATLRFSGAPSDELWAKVNEGMLMYVSLNGTELSIENMLGIIGAASSSKCRLRELSLDNCSVDRLSVEKDGGFPLNVVAQAAVAFTGVELSLTSGRGGADWGSAENAQLLIDTAAGMSGSSAGGLERGEMSPEVTFMHRMSALYNADVSKPVVDLKNRSIDDAGAAIIGQGLSTNTTLETLDLRGNQFGAAGQVAIAEGLSTNTTLKTLNGFEVPTILLQEGTTIDLSSKKVDDLVAIIIGHALSTNTTLETLDLRESNVGNAGGAAIAEGLSTNTTLKTLNGFEVQIIRLQRAGTMLDLSRKLVDGLVAMIIGHGLATNTTLKKLDLRYSKIGDAGAAAIGQGLATNTALKTLNLRDNSIDDAGAAAIGQGLATNTALETLTLYDNSIGDAGAAAIGQGLATNTALKKLDLRGNKIGDAGKSAIADGLSTNTTLKTLNEFEVPILRLQQAGETLDLSSKTVDDLVAVIIGAGLATNTALKTLYLSGNSIGAAGAAAIGQGLATNTALKELTLWGNSIGDAGAAAIGQGLATNTALVKIDLSGDYKHRGKIGDAGAAAIGQGLATNTALKELILKRNSIGDAGAAAVGQGLATNTALKELILERNSIGDAGAAAVGQGLATNTALETLDLRDNSIGAAGAAAVGKGLATNTALKELRLGVNSIGDAGAAAVGKGLATNTALETLDLRDNSIGAAGAAAVGKGLATNTALKTLNLGGNSIGDAGAAAIGQALATNTALETLMLGVNSIGDAGAAAIGQGLATNTTLGTLLLYHSSMSSGARAALNAAAPNVDIRF